MHNKIHDALDDVEDSLLNFFVTIFRDKDDVLQHDSYRKSLAVFLRRAADRLENWEVEKTRVFIEKEYGTLLEKE